jgi:hypothetical protein
MLVPQFGSRIHQKGAGSSPRHKNLDLEPLGLTLQTGEPTNTNIF